MTRSIITLLALALVAIAVFSPSYTPGHEQAQLPGGEVIENIVCKADPQHSYSLFLPSGYTPEKKWPIIYAFDQNKNLSDRRVARRVLQSLLVDTYEEVNALYQKKNYAPIPGKLELAATIRPKDARIFYDLAAAYSRVGNKGKSLAALSRAIENGFADANKIEQNDDFAAIRNEAEYKRLIAGLKKTT